MGCNEGGICATDGYAFSQEEHGYMSQVTGFFIPF